MLAICQALSKVVHIQYLASSSQRPSSWTILDKLKPREVKTTGPKVQEVVDSDHSFTFGNCEP